MKRDYMDNFLRLAPAFSNLSDQVIKEIKVRLYKKLYPEGRIIFLEGEPVSTLYIVEMGKIEIYKESEEGKKLTIWHINSGEIFCVPAFVIGNALTNAMAVKDTLVYCLDKVDFDSIIHRFPEISSNLLRCLSKRIFDYSRAIERISFNNTLRRIAHILLNNLKTDNAGITFCALSQNEIAFMAGVCRETVCRALKKLTADNIISVRHREIIINDPRKLIEINKGKGH